MKCWKTAGKCGLAYVLTLLMCLNMLPLTALADTEASEGLAENGEEIVETLPEDTAGVNCTVTFHAGSGTVIGDPAITVESGKTVETLPAAIRSGYVFKGWFNGDDEFTGETPVTADITVTAKWAQTFTVTIEDGQGGSIFKTVRLSGVEEGAAVSAGDIDEIIAKGEELGWKLIGWARVKSSNPVCYQPYEPLVVTNKNFVKLIAKWDINTHTVTIDGKEYEIGHGSSLAALLPGDPPVREGHTFAGWFSGGEEVTAETVLTGEMTIEARWDINTYTVMIDGEEYVVEHGSTLANILPGDPTREGYTFDGWFDSEGGEITAETVVTGEMTVTARWTQNSSGVMIPGGTSGGSTSGGSVSGAAPGTAPGNEEEEIETPDVPLAGTPVSSVFTDVGSERWYTGAVQFVYDRDLMTGVSATSFAPDLSTTRGMIVTMLYRMEGTPDAAGSVYTDVAAGAWYGAAVSWGTRYGVVSGYGEGLFGPGDSITREQLAVILFRYAQLRGCDVSARSDLSGYTDAEQLSAYAVEAMSWANAAGLINGRTGAVLDPAGYTSRAETAAVFMRFCQSFAETERAEM